MNTELTDEQINELWMEALRLEWRNRAGDEWHFARAVIAADRALREPAAQQALKLSYDQGVEDGKFVERGMMRLSATSASPKQLRQDARHREELAAYELTVSNLRAAQGVTEGWVMVSTDTLAGWKTQVNTLAGLSGQDRRERTIKLKQEIADVLAAAPQPAAQPCLDRDRIRAIFMDHGFTIKEGQSDLKEYVYDAANALLAAAAPQPAAQAESANGGPDIHALFWQLRSKLLKLPRYSFLPNSGGGVERVPDRCGKWIEVDDAAGLCEVESVDALIAAAPPGRGEIVVTKNEAGRIVAVTRQDEEGRILEVIATDIRFERELEPKPTSVSLSKRAELEADGYVVNGLALMHPETRQRVLLDYCGFVGWYGPIPEDAP